jgi:HlyD family secretion protein
MSKKPLVIAAVVLLAGAGTLAWWQTGHHTGDSANALVLHGNVDIRQVNLAFNASERIASMAAEEGQKIHTGEVLAVLDSQRLMHTVDQLAAQAEAQSQVVARLEAGSRPEEIARARAGVLAAQANAENTERNAKRLAKLVDQHLASREQTDNARAAADAAAAQLKVAQEDLALMVAGPRKEDIAAARATLQANRAQLALARRQLADTRLLAPADGVVENRLLEPGDMASPLTPVYTVALNDPVWVRAYVAEPDLGKLQPGMHAAVQTDSYPGKEYPAWIGFISPTAEFTPKSVETREVRSDLVYQVRVFVCNPEGQLRLGMPASVTIPLGQKPDTLGSPAQTHCRE